MSTLVFALALFGCSDDAASCERLSDKAQNFTSRASCEKSIEAAFDSEIVRRSDYPTVLARCMPRAELTRLGNRTVDLSRPVVRLAGR